MRIDSVRILHVSLPLVVPEMFGPRRLSSYESVLVGLSSSGQTGWGEASPGTVPLEDSQWANGAFLCLKEWLVPDLIGADVPSGDALAERLAHVSGNHAAKAALDIAWWNLAARQQGQSLAALLADSAAPLVPVQLGCLLGQRATTEELLADVAAAVAAGQQSVGLKLGPGWAIEVVRAVRAAFPALRLWVDCDAQCGLEQRDLFFRLEDFQLERLEQPFAADDLVAHAMLQETIRTPICLDQSITSLERLEQALDLESCRQVRVDPQRVGGLTAARTIAERCRAASVPCLVGVRRQTAIGGRAALALVAARRCDARADLAWPAQLAADMAPLPAVTLGASGAELATSEFERPSPSPAGDALEKYLVARSVFS